MPWFRCLVVGENFVFDNGEAMGFATTRWVEAEHKDHAESIALELLRSDENLSKKWLRTNSPNAKVMFEEIEEVENGDRAPGKGFTWFSMENDKISTE